jgi:hypothetical protein
MIIGIFTQVADAEGALNNLAEADFKPSNISLIMATKEQAQVISDTSGILTGTPVEELADALVKAGLKKDALKYQDMIKKGGVFIAVATKNYEIRIYHYRSHNRHYPLIFSFPSQKGAKAITTAS